MSSRTARKNIGRAGAVVAATALGLAAFPGGAGAEESADNGQRTGPVQFWAEGNDECQVDFTISNETNSKGYTVDYRIDSQPLNGPDAGTGPTGRIALSSDAAAPIFSATPGEEVGYVSNRTPAVLSEKTITLTDFDDLPNVGADNHTVEYRMILGPESKHRGDGSWHTATVTGCAEGETPVPETPGSLDWLGSVDLFGSLGSSDQEAPSSLGSHESSDTKLGSS